VLKREDRLPSAEDTSTATASNAPQTTIEKTPSNKIETSSTTSSEAVATATTCRRYSAATDSLIETPCQ
jgi:hypothetical protein